MLRPIPSDMMGVQLRISDSLDIVSWLILLIAPLSYL